VHTARRHRDVLVGAAEAAGAAAAARARAAAAEAALRDARAEAAAATAAADASSAAAADALAENGSLRRELLAARGAAAAAAAALSGRAPSPAPRAASPLPPLSALASVAAALPQQHAPQPHEMSRLMADVTAEDVARPSSEAAPTRLIDPEVDARAARSPLPTLAMASPSTLGASASSPLRSTIRAISVDGDDAAT
jgi:hypothetical protein